MNSFGTHSMTAPLRRVAVRRPPEALSRADPREWHYLGEIDLERARREHDIFVNLLEMSGALVELMDQDPDAYPDSMFTHDPSMLTREGAVITHMGKSLRRDEAQLHADFYAANDIPILGWIKPPGTMEAGDTLWIDSDTLAVGCGYRTNEEGIAQFTHLMDKAGVTVIPFDLPAYQGHQACVHLMSLVSLLSDDLALVHTQYTPVRLIRLLEDRGYVTIPMPNGEFEASNTISGNILTTGPLQCIMVEGLEQTRKALVTAGCDVKTFSGDELCIKAEGGPTCLTRPLLRTH